MQQVTWSDHWSYNFRTDPKRLAFVLSRYKFAAAMGSKNRTVLEMGCGEGIGSTVLAETAVSYTGVDLDKEAIISAQKNLVDTSIYIYLRRLYGKNFRSLSNSC